MPELPEVETVVRGLRPCLEGRRLARVEQRRENLRFPFPENFAQRLEGRRVARIGRRAKYILMHLDDDQVLLCHLGMSGRMTIGDSTGAPPDKHDHVILTTDEGREVRFNDARRFGIMDLVSEAGLASHPLLAELGPEPLGNDFNGPELARRLAGKRSAIKAALLDQRVVAAHAVRAVLDRAIAAGGSSLRDYVQASGELGYFQHSWAVYDREGARCPGCDCDSAATGGIRRIVQSNRSTFYCAVRQR
jgi:formamidopyrimidine-DNA glycosylase